MLRVSLSSIVLGWRLEGARLCVASGDGTQNHRMKWSIESGWCFGLEVGPIIYTLFFNKWRDSMHAKGDRNDDVDNVTHVHSNSKLKKKL